MFAMDQPVLMQMVKIFDIFLRYEMFLPLLLSLLRATSGSVWMMTVVTEG